MDELRKLLNKQQMAYRMWDAVPGTEDALGMDASAVDDAGKKMIASYWMQQDERGGEKWKHATHLQ